MIKALDKQFEVVRTVSESDINDVLVCKSLTAGDNKLYTIIGVKEKALCTRLLDLFSRNDLSSWSGGFQGITVSDSNLLIIFDYNAESRLFYYKTLYWRSFSDRLKTAKNLISELMAYNLPNEIVFFMLEDENINLMSDGRVYFNYFMDLAALPPEISNEDIACKAANVVLRILSDGLNTTPKELLLLKRKISNRAFNSFASVYMTLREIPDEIEEGIPVSHRAKRILMSGSSKAKLLLKASFPLLIVAASLFYTVGEIRARSVPVSASAETETEYTGLRKIGTVYLDQDYEDSELSDADLTEQEE